MLLLTLYSLVSSWVRVWTSYTFIIIPFVPILSLNAFVLCYGLSRLEEAEPSHLTIYLVYAFPIILIAVGGNL